ncbi:hypothetical protein GCM10027596_31510 [Nocardioides korecus]
MTGAGAVVGAVGLAASPASAAVTRRSAGSAQESVVAYIEDHSSDELHLMVGEREVVVHDHDLVARILNAAGGQ